MPDCMYCEGNAFRESLMEFLCELPYSSVYLFRDQRYYGRCVCAFRGRHITEIFQMTTEERNGFFSDVALVAAAAKKITNADKINYAIFGDLAQHLHVHIVPKRINGPEWGGPFLMDGEKKTLSEEKWGELRKAYEKFFLDQEIT